MNGPGHVNGEAEEKAADRSELMVGPEGFEPPTKGL
jgi:hypothetical protein